MAKKQEAKTENKTVEISKEILTQIEELKNNKQILIQELGEISIAEITLEERRETAETFLKELKKMEQKVENTGGWAGAPPKDDNLARGDRRPTWRAGHCSMGLKAI